MSEHDDDLEPVEHDAEIEAEELEESGAEIDAIHWEAEDSHEDPDLVEDEKEL